MKKTLHKKNMKDLTFEVSNISTQFLKIIFYRGPNIYDVQAKGVGKCWNLSPRTCQKPAKNYHI